MGMSSRFLAKMGLSLIGVVIGPVCLADVPPEAEKCLLEGKWEQVLRHLPAADISRDPIAEVLNACACFATGEYKEATEHFSRLGKGFDGKELTDYASRLAQQNPRNPNAKMVLGYALARAGNCSDALKALDEGIRLDPGSALIYDLRGVVNAMAGRPEAAEADFRRAKETAPLFADVLCNLGLLQLQNGEWDEAVELLGAAIGLAPDFAVAYNGRGVAYLQVGDSDRALNDLDRAVKLNPDFYAAASNLRIAEWYKARLSFRDAIEQGEPKVAGVIRQQVIVIDIPGIETQGEHRPTQWGPVLIGSPTFSRHNIRHEGALRDNLQAPEPGVTTCLPREWEESRARDLLSLVLADIKAGKSAYIKIDQNIKLAGYLDTQRPLEEGKWVWSVGNWLSDQIRQINPGVKLVLNGHSKGTLDAHRMDLSRFNQVILSSDRGSVPDVQRLVNRFPDTRFTLVTADRDIPHGVEGFLKLEGKNLTVINLKSGGLLPTTVHSQVADPMLYGTFEVKTTPGTQVRDGRLGELVAGSTIHSAQPGDLVIRHHEKEGTLGPIGGIPHMGIFTGPRATKNGEPFSVVSPEVDPGGKGVFRPRDWTDRDAFKDPGFFSVLDSQIPIRYRGLDISMADLPATLKQSIRDDVIREAESRIGGSYGDYRLTQFPSGHSNNCGDATLDIYDNVLAWHGVKVLAHKFPGSDHFLPGGMGLREGKLKDYAEVLGFGGSGTTDPSRLAGWLPRVSPPSSESNILQHGNWILTKPQGVGLDSFMPVRIVSPSVVAGTPGEPMPSLVEDVIRRTLKDKPAGARPTILLYGDRSAVDSAATWLRQHAKGFGIQKAYTDGGLTPETHYDAARDALKRGCHAAVVLPCAYSVPSHPASVPDTVNFNKDKFVPLFKPLIGPFPPDKFGGAAVSPTNYRLPSTFSPVDNRGGVKMEADIVKGEAPDMSGLFCAEPSGRSSDALCQGRLYCPFLLFCAMREELKIP